MFRLVRLLAPCALLSACFGSSDGLEVPRDQIYFPVGLALDAASSHLFVVSSDFDLQYNGGAIQSYRLEEVFEHLPKPCAEDAHCQQGTNDGSCGSDGLCRFDGQLCPRTAERPAADQLLYPSPCSSFELTPVSTAKIGAFATDVVLRARADGPAGAPAGAPERLFVPVRGDTTLHWLDVSEGRLDCNQSSRDGACSRSHRAGQDAAQENTRGLELAAEPFAIDANVEGSAIVVTNQTSGTASLFVHDWSDDGPQLRFALSSDRIPSRPVGIASLPRTSASLASATPDAFLMTFRNAAQVRLVRFADDAESSPEREYLVDNGGVTIDANSVGSDSRGIAIDASARQAAVARCDGDAACVASAELTPLDVYVANRAPSSLLIGRTRPPLEYPYFFQSLPLTVGPSRVVVGKVRAASGELETRVFVVCFDSRRIFVYDPARGRFEVEILTGRGPHAVAVDSERALLYVGHFTDSFVGVFSLDLAFPASYGSMLGMLGTPRPPRSSK
jgi:hypothetical protein